MQPAPQSMLHSPMASHAGGDRGLSAGGPTVGEAAGSIAGGRSGLSGLDGVAATPPSSPLPDHRQYLGLASHPPVVAEDEQVEDADQDADQQSQRHSSPLEDEYYVEPAQIVERFEYVEVATESSADEPILSQSKVCISAPQSFTLPDELFFVQRVGKRKAKAVRTYGSRSKGKGKSAPQSQEEESSGEEDEEEDRAGPSRKGKKHAPQQSEEENDEEAAQAEEADNEEEEEEVTPEDEATILSSKHYRSCAKKLAKLAYKLNPKFSERTLTFSGQDRARPAIGDFVDGDGRALSRAVVHYITYLFCIDFYPSKPLRELMVSSAIRAGAHEQRVVYVEKGDEYDHAVEVVSDYVLSEREANLYWHSGRSPCFASSKHLPHQVGRQGQYRVWTCKDPLAWYHHKNI